MAIDSNAFYKSQESRAQSGYKAAILVKDPTSTITNKYQLLVASTSVPSIFGTNDSFEFDLLNSPTKGKVQGKFTLDDKEVEVLHHRDNVVRFERLKDRVLDFMVIDSQFVGYKFTGTLSYRMNDASAEVLMGTYTITPMSASTTPVLNARSEVVETLCFASAIPDTVGKDTKVSYAVAQSGATVTCNVYTLNGVERSTATTTTDGVNTTDKTIDFSKFGTYKGQVVEIVVEATGYAPASTTVYIDETGFTA